MSALIFPYTNPDNPVLKKIEDKIDKFSLLWVKQLNEPQGMWGNVYDKIYYPCEDIIKNVCDADKYFSDKYIKQFEIDFRSEFLSNRTQETESSILKELKDGGGSKNFKNADEENIDGKEFFKYLFLMLFDRHEKNQQDLNLELESIEKREKEIFNKLMGSDHFKDADTQKNKKDSLPSDFKNKRLLYWLKVLIENNSIPGVWITDDEEYIDLLKEFDQGIQELNEKTEIDEKMPDLKKYITSLSFYDLLVKVLGDSYLKNTELMDEKLIIALV